MTAPRRQHNLQEITEAMGIGRERICSLEGAKLLYTWPVNRGKLIDTHHGGVAAGLLALSFARISVRGFGWLDTSFSFLNNRTSSVFS